MTEIDGVSFVICTYNGSRLLPPTLKHLMRQESSGGLPWEVVVVDNASTDDTAKVAERLWRTDSSAPLRVIREPRLGLAFARERGLDSAKYEIVSFVDDDNWVGDGWVTRIAEVMKLHPEAAAVGGVCEAAPEITPPAWFDRLKNYYAIGPDLNEAGEVPMLWGAGLSLRRSVWRKLRQRGFNFLTKAQCEDQEITLAIRLAGWKLWFDPRMRLRHFVPAQRLTWKYFLSVQRVRERALVLVDPYLAALEKPYHGEAGLPRRVWIDQMSRTSGNLLFNLVRRPQKFLSRSSARHEGDDDALRIERFIGRLEGLIDEAASYDQNMRAVAKASWRNIASTPVIK